MKQYVAAVTTVFVVLKLSGVVAWSWWWVLSPLWITAALFVVAVLLALTVFRD